MISEAVIGISRKYVYKNVITTEEDKLTEDQVDLIISSIKSLQKYLLYTFNIGLSVEQMYKDGLLITYGWLVYYDDEWIEAAYTTDVEDLLVLSLDKIKKAQKGKIDTTKFRIEAQYTFATNGNVTTVLFKPETGRILVLFNTDRKTYVDLTDDAILSWFIYNVAGLKTIELRH